MGKIFKRGLFALAPVALSIAIVIWLLGTLEDIFRVPLKAMVGEYYFPGMGVIVAVVFIFFVGIIINNFLMQKITGLLDRFFARIPFFKIVYNAIADMMGFFSPKDSKKKGKMVVIEFDSLRFLGMMTREDFEGLPSELGEDDRVTVYVPLSYQIGGVTFTIPRSRVKEVDMSVEEGMRFIVTAGVLSGKNQADIKKTKDSKAVDK